MSAPVTVGIIGATLVLAVPLLTATASLEAAHRAASAADAAALAAADALIGYMDEDPCEVSARVAASQSATLDLCETGAYDARVVVSVPTLYGDVTKRARAGVPGIADPAP